MSSVRTDRTLYKGSLFDQQIIMKYVSCKCERKCSVLQSFAHISLLVDFLTLKVHKIEIFVDSDFGIFVISFLVMSKY